MSENRLHSRRAFVRNVAAGAGALAMFRGIGLIAARVSGPSTVKAIFVDFTRCTGCRTCETVCSSVNNRVNVAGTVMNGLGNPERSNIRVWHYNPDVDVPVTCFLCDDAPCIQACPIEQDPRTGRRALYRDPDLHTIKCDYDRCIGCGSCADACAATRGGIIAQNRGTGKPERICTLCDGDPACVRYCPYGALSFREYDLGDDLRNRTPDQIAESLIRLFYETESITL